MSFLKFCICLVVVVVVVVKSVCRTVESEKKNFSKKKRVVVTGETIKSKYVNNTKKMGRSIVFLATN